MPATPFTQAADELLAKPKRLLGRFVWRPLPGEPDQDGFWPVEVDGQLSKHRLHAEARLGSDVSGFCIMLSMHWAESLIPVVRLNVDSDAHAHINRPPRPSAVPAEVTGPRYFPWRINRGTFKPPMRHLPFAVELERKHQTLENALRFVAGETNIDLAAVALPDYPSRRGLFG